MSASRCCATRSRAELAPVFRSPLHGAERHTRERGTRRALEQWIEGVGRSWPCDNTLSSGAGVQKSARTTTPSSSGGALEREHLLVRGELGKSAGRVIAISSSPRC